MWSGLRFAEYEQQRRAMLALAPPHLLDGGETNLYRTLARHDPQRFGPVAPSADPKSGYRCHVAEAFLDRLGWDPAAFASRSLVSQGVRHSLALIFGWAATERVTAVLPSDVYPVYEALAAESGVVFSSYEARRGLPWAHLESHRHWGLLVCDPLKPWGGALSAPEWRRLLALAHATQSQVWVDGAYSLMPSAPVRASLTRTPDAPLAFLGSLSKGWLTPGCAGVVISSPALANQWRSAFQGAPKQEGRLREALACLTRYSARPDRVEAVVTHARHALLDRLKERGIPAVAPGQGYFVVSPMAPADVWRRGVLPIPGSVFGSSAANLSVISALGWVGQGG